MLGRCIIKQVLGVEPVKRGESLQVSREKGVCVWRGKPDQIVEEEGDVWDNRDFYLLKIRRLNSLDQLLCH